MKAKLLSLGLALCAASPLMAGEWEHTLMLEGRLFVDEPLYAGQERNSASVAFETEYYTEIGEDGLSFTFKPFFRYDSADDERTHADLREAFFYWGKGDWEWRAGVSKVFWGVTESRHLVDIINQTDAVENIDGEDKLGQPMIHASLVKDWGVLDMFVLPGFRERTFPGVEGRLRAPLVVDTDNPVYQSSEEESHVDVAVRWSNTLGDWDLGLHYFDGTSRDPRLLPGLKGATPVLIPHYDQIQQVGLDAQAIFEGWIWKLEAIQRESDFLDYSAATGGFEYTVVSVIGGDSDLGLLMEYHYDERQEEADTPLQDDLFLGGRWAFNDADSSEILAGVIIDMEDDSQGLRLEANTRLSSGLTLTVEGQAFSNVDEQNLQYALRDDGFVQVELAYYF